jgi:signal transduction histidine kinase
MRMVMATLAPAVLPALVLVAALVAALVLLHRYRARRRGARQRERLMITTAERERIARMLHDTILQTVQALVMRLDAIVVTLPAGDRTRNQLETLLSHTSAAITEGRDQVHQLRTAGLRVVEQIVAERIGRLRATYPDVVVTLRVDGSSRALQPDQADEVATIAGEALRNACRHAQASRVDIRLTYGRRALTVSVHDDGRGLNRRVARDGYRHGHWGLIGMRERAERLGARLSTDSGAGVGTTVTLVIPARRAYRKR